MKCNPLHTLGHALLFSWTGKGAEGLFGVVFLGSQGFAKVPYEKIFSLQYQNIEDDRSRRWQHFLKKPLCLVWIVLIEKGGGSAH
ncbi:hypothetical protein [Desulfosoma caldarium]|uniref:hypothetical protein n=1 Tax=Desulfosoma caldarium TaxID=610254 RepID=UPI0011CE5B61|nr:hypothetical protein [Desulfosoma caldarium]